VSRSGPAPWTSSQARAIARAVEAGRAAVRETGRADRLAFARAYVEAGGVQVPGRPDEDGRAGEIAAALLHALGRGATSDDPDVAREIVRVERETALAGALRDPHIVGFVVDLGETGAADPACQALLGRDFGLGAAVWPRSRVAVPPPWCLDYAFLPIGEGEVEM